ncbi:MAG: nuclear transport factor 2 family protein [Sphingomonas sp.]|uniref:YybH family protein n=1 Tax=Sphingomonas sp. TaxID=28214 RepID=UPI0025E67E04|nr:nuclear transport factor 2 family protein [Sphingomonas sp.]MBX3564153.1 nuclear transport factor 2 family protein [Sphingomonas sp.]
MSPAEKRDVIADLHHKLVAYWHDVDFNWGRNAAEYYTEDAIFEIRNGSNPYHGRAEIRAFYTYRHDRGPRVVVHAISNFLCDFEDDARVRSSWICMIYAHDGEPPQVSAPPIAISRVDDILVLQDDDWLIERRTWNPLFRGGVKSTHASAEDIAKRLGTA